MAFESTEASAWQRVERRPREAQKATRTHSEDVGGVHLSNFIPSSSVSPATTNLTSRRETAARVMWPINAARVSSTEPPADYMCAGDLRSESDRVCCRFSSDASKPFSCSVWCQEGHIAMQILPINTRPRPGYFKPNSINQQGSTSFPSNLCPKMLNDLQRTYDSGLSFEDNLI